MRSINARHVVFGLMVAAVAVFSLAYANNSRPWSGSAYATLPSASTPAAPINLHKVAITPGALRLGWSPDLASGATTPTSYQLFVDGAPRPSQTGTDALIRPLVPGSRHTYQVFASAFGRTSEPSTISVTQPKAPVALGKPVVPTSGVTTRAIRVSGKIVSAYPVGTASVVRLKFYRRQRNSAGTLVWVWKKTVTASRPTTTSYALSLRLKPIGRWSVIARFIGDSKHLPATSVRSSSILIR